MRAGRQINRQTMRYCVFDVAGDDVIGGGNDERCRRVPAAAGRR